MPNNLKSDNLTDRRIILSTAVQSIALSATSSAAALGSAPTPPEPEEVVPLKAVFSSRRIKGMLDAPANRFVEGDNGLKRSLYRVKDIGPSNLFLVRSDTIDGAVETTFSTLVGEPRIDQAVAPLTRKKDDGRFFWAFFYFGAASSSPLEWTPTRVSVQRERVLMTVTRPDRIARLGINTDECVYMFWVPLGERKDKAFTLTAIDETNHTAIMSRYVTV